MSLFLPKILESSDIVMFCPCFSRFRTTIQPLRLLSQLQYLNLKGNRISTIASIAVISSLQNLKQLFLSGNPIELSENYPNNVFELQPRLKSVDHWERSGNHGSSKGKNNHEDSSQDEPLPTLQYVPVGSLECELQATKEAFDLQERTLAANGQDLARLCASLASPHRKQSPFGATPETEVLENFPYYRMLQTWRKQAQSCTVLRTLAEHDLQRAVSAAQRDRQELLTRAQEQEARTLLWKQRSAGWEDKCRTLEQVVCERDSALAGAAQEAELRCQQLYNLTQEHRNLAMYLKHMKTQADQHAVLQTAEVARGAERLRQLEGRVAAAADRVAFTAEIVAQKEVQVRNSLAALDAEHRLLQLTKQSGAPPNATDSATVAATATAGVAPYCTGGVQLEPEAEALLRAIFRTMDPEDSGLVSVQLLLKCLLVSDVPQQAPLDGAECEGEGDSTAVATPLGEMVQGAVGTQQWRRLISALQALSRSATSDVTWGEFLLQFIPGSVGSSAAASSAKLNSAEIRDLRRAGLLGDLDWGLFPLQLPTPGTPAVQQAHSRNNASARSPEHRQLLAERRYLMQRLQDMTRTLERRAEGIKAYFEGSIRREQLKEERMSTQISEVQHSLTVSQARQAELEQLLAHSRAQYEIRVPQLEAQVESLRESMRATHREVVDKYEAVLQVEAGKVAALESKIEALKKDCSNRDIKRRSLESDLRRLSESQKTSMGEICSLKERLTDAQHALKNSVPVAECEAQLRAKEEVWEAGRAQARSELEDLRAKLDTCTAQLAEATAVEAARTAAQIAQEEQRQHVPPSPSVNATSTAPSQGQHEPPGVSGSAVPAKGAIETQEQLEKVRQLQTEVHRVHHAMVTATAGVLPSVNRNQLASGPPAGSSATQAHLDSVLRRLEQCLSQ